MKISSEGKYQKIRNQIMESVPCKKCVVCDGNEGGDVIGSHTIPKFVLENISNGRNYKSSYQFELPKYEPNKIGIRKAGVFHMLCNKCDTALFKTYETRENYSVPQKEQEILREIALKNAFKKQYDLLIALQFLSIEDEIQEDKNQEIEQCIDYYAALLMANDNEIQKIWDMFGDDKARYKVVYKEILNYVTPIAAQGAFPYKRGIKQKDYEIKNELPWMNLAILPFEKQTIILLFTNEDNKIYDEWIAEFSCMEDVEKLNVVNDMIFSELDDYFIDEEYSAEDLTQLQPNGTITLRNLQKRTLNVSNYLSEQFKIR